MDPASNGAHVSSRTDDERARHERRVRLKELNLNPGQQEFSRLDSSLKRHTTLIKRIRQSMAADNKDQILKDLESLSLEKYIDEIAGAVTEGIARCKTDKDTWGAVEVISHLHRRFPRTFTPVLVSSLSSAIAPPSKANISTLITEQREKEDNARISRQRPVLRICSELALVGIIRDTPEKSGGEWVMKAVKELLSNDPSLSSLPLLITFLKSYSWPFLGLMPPPVPKQVHATGEPGSLSNVQSSGRDTECQFKFAHKEEHELIEQDIRDRFKRMCEGYFDNVCKKLVIEHKRLQEQDKRNHEAYIRSGEIFEDRQQAYEKMTKGYEKLLANCQSLSELLYLPLPLLPTASQRPESIQIGSTRGSLYNDSEETIVVGGKWEDEEERRYYEDVQDLKDYVPSSVLGIDISIGAPEVHSKDVDQERIQQEKEEARQLEEELHNLQKDHSEEMNGVDDESPLFKDDDDARTPTPGSPKITSTSSSPRIAPQGPSQLLTALLVRLQDATNRGLIDQTAIDFAFLNSKAARKRLIKALSQVPKNRTDLLPHYSRLVATLNKYMPDIGIELVAHLEDEFRYLQRKKNVVKELAEIRTRNIAFFCHLTKFKIVPFHVILHVFKVCLDDFTGINVDNIAMLLEGCGRFLLRSEDTAERFGAMLELMRRKQGMQHFDQRQILMLENAYYQCNPPERPPKQEKERSQTELFIRHLIYDVLAKKTIDKVLKSIRKLDWENEEVKLVLHKIFTKPWKIKYSSISLLAMLTYDLQRYRPAFSIFVVDQTLEDIRRGLEQNVYNANQKRLATIKFLGELYIYRMFSSSIIFDTLWSLVTFGHPEGRPLPNATVPLDMPDDFFRVRLVCALLDTCGMCFDRGTQRKRLDNFLIFFQYYVYCKQALPMDVDFMFSDSLEAVRPKMQVLKNLEEAALAVDEMYNSAYQAAGLTDESEDSGDDDDDDKHSNADHDEDEGADEDEDLQESSVDDRAPSPDEKIILSASSSKQENFGPSEEADAEFARELAKLVTDTSAESRKVDKKTALALWDSAILPPASRKRRGVDDGDEDQTLKDDESQNIMNFTVITKRGNKQLARQLAIPSASALAVHTRSAQLQDKVEQQHLKRLVLDYEQREEAEELKALETRHKAGGIKMRYNG